MKTFEEFITINLTEESPPDPKIERWILANKERFKKQYGERQGLEILYSKAWKMYKEKQ